MVRGWRQEVENEWNPILDDLVLDIYDLLTPPFRNLPGFDGVRMNQDW